eukprot:3082626-Lingulodinium_polyedra.AAC.1
MLYQLWRPRARRQQRFGRGEAEGEDRGCTCHQGMVDATAACPNHSAFGLATPPLPSATG